MSRPEECKIPEAEGKEASAVKLRLPMERSTHIYSPRVLRRLVHWLELH